MLIHHRSSQTKIHQSLSESIHLRYRVRGLFHNENSSRHVTYIFRIPLVNYKLCTVLEIFIKLQFCYETAPWYKRLYAFCLWADPPSTHPTTFSQLVCFLLHHLAKSWLALYTVPHSTQMTKPVDSSALQRPKLSFYFINIILHGYFLPYLSLRMQPTHTRLGKDSGGLSEYHFPAFEWAVCW